MNENLSFNNTVHYRLFDPDGNLKEEQTTHNQTQQNILEEVIDAVDTGSCNDVVTMAIGTGSGQATSANALGSLSSYETTGAGVQSGSPEDTVTFTSTFTAGGAWSIEEAGLSSAADAASGLLFYDDSISVGMTSGDTLQIDWEVSVS